MVMVGCFVSRLDCDIKVERSPEQWQTAGRTAKVVLSRSVKVPRYEVRIMPDKSKASGEARA